MTAMMSGTSHRFVQANGVTLCVEEMGPADGEPLLLIMGLASQMTLWPPELLKAWVAAGYRVIRFDNRDIGLSSELSVRLKGSPAEAMLRFKLGLSVPAPYTLFDMAADARALLDALGLASAHVIGISMGGMIGQILAARWPERVRSLALIMSSSNSPRLPMPDLRVVWHLQGGGKRGTDEASVLARGVRFWQTVRTQGVSFNEERLRERIRSDYRRSYRPAGILRQMRAVLATGSLEPVSRTIDVPTRIIHGTADPFVKPVAARQLQQLIPHARLSWMQGMGHDLPEALLPEIAEHTLKHLAGER